MLTLLVGTGEFQQDRGFFIGRNEGNSLDAGAVHRRNETWHASFTAILNWGALHLFTQPSGHFLMGKACDT